MYFRVLSELDLIWSLIYQYTVNCGYLEHWYLKVPSYIEDIQFGYISYFYLHFGPFFLKQHTFTDSPK